MQVVNNLHCCVPYAWQNFHMKNVNTILLPLNNCKKRICGEWIIGPPSQIILILNNNLENTMISSNLTSSSKELVLSSKRKSIRVLINSKTTQRVDIDFLSKRDSTILSPSDKFTFKPTMLTMYKRLSTKLLHGRRTFIKALRPSSNSNLNKIEP